MNSKDIIGAYKALGISKTGAKVYRHADGHTLVICKPDHYGTQYSWRTADKSMSVVSYDGSAILEKLLSYHGVPEVKS